MIEQKKIDLSEERLILSRIIADTEFLRQLSPIIHVNLFSHNYSKMIVKWVIEYYEHTRQAPEKAIQDIYINKRATLSEDDDEIIQNFLSSLSDDWKVKKNYQYEISKAIEFFKIQSLDYLQKRLAAAVSRRDFTEGEKIVSTYSRIQHSLKEGVNVLFDADAIASAFQFTDEVLFKLPGFLGEATGDFVRGDFAAWAGPAKRGKSHYMWMCGHRAVLTGHSVLFISLEMTQAEMLRRMWRTFEAVPRKSGEVNLSYFVEATNGKYDVEIKTEDRKINTNPEVINSRLEYYRKQTRTGQLRLITAPSANFSVADLESKLESFEHYEGFQPDVIILDYADIMASDNYKQEKRHQLDQIWLALRGLAQKKNICIITGSQTGRVGYTRDSKAGDIAEDYRKLAHVTKLFLLNQTEKERELGIMRIETGVKREGKSHSGQIVVLQSLDIGRPYMDSKDKNEVNLPDEKKDE